MAKKLSIESEMKAAQIAMKKKLSGEDHEVVKKVKKKAKTVKEQYNEIKESLKEKDTPKEIAFKDNYEEELIKELFKGDITVPQALGKEDEIESPKRERSGLWDYVLEDEIEFFDPECSYELTGYKPITETKGLDFNPEWFTEAARTYTETGNYTEYPAGSKSYCEYWLTQLDRCTNGYTVNGYRLTPDHYFFLNFYRMNIVDDSKKAATGSEEGFPRFIAEQYKFFHYFEMCERLKRDVVALKSRGIGWSEIGACLAVRPFVTQRNFNSTFIASALNYLEPTLDKCWNQLNFLNGETNGGFRRPMMVINNVMHKRTSKQDNERREWGRKNDIEGIVADNSNKVRGRRIDRLMFEESGSYSGLRTAWTKGEALVTVAGARKGIMSAWGCVCAGTKVYSGNGNLCNIEDITPETGIIGFNGSTGNLEQVTYIQPEGYKECVQLKTSLGGELKCSIDHPLLVLVKSSVKHNWYCTFKKAGDLTVNDTLLMSNNIETFGSITEPDAYLLGMLFGDGSYMNNSNVTLSVTTEEVFQWLNETYDIGISKLRESSEGIYAQVYLKKMHPLLKKYRMDHQAWHNKKLPNSIWEWDKESICDFIGGYFEADGNIQIIRKKHRAIKLTSCYKHNVEAIQYLLLKLGINSYILKEVKKGNGKLHSKVNNKVYNIAEQHDCYVLYIDNSYYINRFKELIHFKSKYKQERLESYNENSSISIYNDISFKISENGKGKFFIGKTINNVQGVKIKSIENIGINRIYNLTANSTHTYITNRFISSNTGGDENPTALQGLSEMFNDPNAFNILPYKNNYSEDGSIQYTGYFIPAYNIMLKSGFTDNRGVTNIQKAKDYYESERKKKSGQALLEYCAEYCWNPQEALLKQGDGIFDPIVIADRLTQLRIQKIGIKPQRVDLLWDCPNNAETNPRNKVKLIPNSQGKVFIYEPPLKDGEGNPYKNLYVAGIDSIDQGTADSSTNNDVSDFCIVIKKRILGSSSSNYVAIYKDRPRDIATAYENAMKLCVYYNCKAMLEHTKISIIMYFRSKKKDNLFMTRPKSTMPDIRKGNSAMIGYPATETYLRHGLELISRFVDESCYVMQIDEMLEQLLKYSWENKRKFDIVAAMIAAELGDEDLLGYVPKAQDEIKKTWKDFGWYYDSYGQKRYGIIPQERK